MKSECSLFLLHRLLSTASITESSLPLGSKLLHKSISQSKAISRLKSTLLTESDPDKIFDLIHSPIHPSLFHSNPALYEISVSKLYRARRFDFVERILESQKSDPAAPKDESFFIRIMSLYTNASMLDHVLQTFEQIPATIRTDKSLCTLLNAFIKYRRFDEVRSLFHRITGEFGMVPGVSVYNVFLTALCNCGEIGDARNMFDEMPKLGLKLDAVSYNVMLSGYLKNRDRVGFEDVLKEMNVKGIVPNVVTYNLRMLHFCNRLESFKAEELLEVMISKGVRPYLSNFNTVIQGFCKEGNFESATRVFKRMNTMRRAKGEKVCLPNAETYAMLIRGLVDSGDFASAEPLCKECLIRKFVPPFQTLKVLINQMVKDSKVAEANDLVDKMRKVVKGSAVESWAKLESELQFSSDLNADSVGSSTVGI